MMPRLRAQVGREEFFDFAAAMTVEIELDPLNSLRPGSGVA